MNLSQFKRWLSSKGVEFVEGSKHAKLYFKGKQSTLPRHAGREIGEGLRKAIIKQLGLKE